MSTTIVEDGITYTITQLPTRKDRVRQIATTKERYFYGPGTILLIKYSNGAQHQIEYPYDPEATLDSLSEGL